MTLQQKCPAGHSGDRELLDPDSTTDGTSQFLHSGPDQIDENEHSRKQQAPARLRRTVLLFLLYSCRKVCYLANIISFVCTAKSLRPKNALEAHSLGLKQLHCATSSLSALLQPLSLKALEAVRCIFALVLVFVVARTRESVLERSLRDFSKRF